MDDNHIKEHAYLVNRGVRAMALIGHCPAEHLEMLKIATKIEGLAEPGVIPFVIDRGDGMADYGYAAKSWVVNLYEWVVCASEETVPPLQRHRILGLLLGYSADAIRDYEEMQRGRRFNGLSASVAPVSM
jgi:hypothetical protein